MMMLVELRTWEGGGGNSEPVSSWIIDEKDEAKFTRYMDWIKKKKSSEESMEEIMSEEERDRKAADEFEASL